MDSDLIDELREAGVSEAEASELAGLAQTLEQLPPLPPRPMWSETSKRRLLDHFDQRPAGRGRAAKKPEG